MFTPVVQSLRCQCRYILIGDYRRVQGYTAKLCSLPVRAFGVAWSCGLVQGWAGPSTYFRLVGNGGMVLIVDIIVPHSSIPY